MGFFECCRTCPSTKRHLGCHSTCKDYLDDKKLWEETKEKYTKESQRLSDKIDSLQHTLCPPGRRRRKHKH